MFSRGNYASHVEAELKYSSRDWKLSEGCGAYMFQTKDSQNGKLQSNSWCTKCLDKMTAPLALRLEPPQNNGKIGNEWKVGDWHARDFNLGLTSLLIVFNAVKNQTGYHSAISKRQGLERALCPPSMFTVGTSLRSHVRRHLSGYYC